MDKETMDFLKEFRSEVNKEFREFRSEVNSKLDEHTQILRALEHSAEVNKAEHDNMKNDIAHIKGDVEALRKDICNVEIVTASNWADIAKLKAVK